MLTLRPSDERGHADHGWLNTFHTFSFADYYDPKWMHFRSLRVINEDHVAGGQGFGTHPHQDMEIITVVLSGALEHRDSMGNRGVIRPGEVQRMSAGTGVRHSEFNASETEPVHLLQIWIMPEKRGTAPSYEQKAFDVTQRENRLLLLAAKEAREGSLSIHQDAELYTSRLFPGQSVTHRLKEGRSAWLQLYAGEVSVAGAKLTAGDGIGITQQADVEISALGAAPAEFLLFDLA